jgi:hypothetical protein
MTTIYTQHGWTELAPTHSKPRRILASVELAWYEYNAAVNRYMDGRGTQAEIDRLAALAEAADEANQSCTCTTGDDLCPSCQRYYCQHEHTVFQGRYHETLGDVDDDIVEVCIDCGKILD